MIKKLASLALLAGLGVTLAGAAPAQADVTADSSVDTSIVISDPAYWCDLIGGVAADVAVEAGITL